MRALLFKTAMLVSLVPIAVNGQQTADYVFSLKQCIQLSFDNNLKLRQTQLEKEKSRYQLKEAVGAGLPQISGYASFENYYDIPVNMVSGDIIGQPGTMVPIQLGTKYTANSGIQASQMIYDASYFASVSLFKKSCEISNLNLELNKEELAYNIAQLYLFIQTTDKQLVLLDSNLVAFRKTYTYSEQHYKNGFILRSDLDRVTVVINNLETERENLLLSQNKQLNMLKYLMGIDANRNITLSGDLASLNIPTMVTENTFDNQIEMRILEQKKNLAEMNIELTKAALLPSVSAYAGYSYLSPVEKFGDMGNNDNWYKSSFVGMRLTVPIFEGNRIKSKVNQGKIEFEQAITARRDMQEELDIKLRNAFQEYNANMSSEVKQKNNMDLAENVFKMINQQYGQGLKSLTEVLNARSEYNASHLLWLNSILQIKLSKLEIMKINGTINSLLL